MKQFIKTAHLGFVMLLWLLAIAAKGTAATAPAAQDARAGSSNAVTEEVMVYDFTANPELIQGLATAITGWNAANRHVTLSINNYSFTLHNCLRGNGYLSVRGDYEDKDTGPDPGYVSGSMHGEMTQLKIEKRAGSGSITVAMTDKNGNVTETTKSVSGSGTVTFDIPEGQRVMDAQSIAIKTNFKCNITKITITRLIVTPDTEEPWVVFKTLNTNPTKVTTYPTDKEATCLLPVGQIVQMVSNGIEGFDPVSAMSNPYVVVYTTDGTEPQFSNQKDGSGKYWKNGNDNDADGNPIGRNGYVYRRGIVLGNWTKNPDGSITTDHAGDKVTVWIRVYKVTDNDDGTWTYTMAHETKKEFTYDSTPRRPLWDTQKDIVFIPNTSQKTPVDSWTSSMKVLDPTENVTVAENNWTGSNTIVAKFSHNDNYDLQSLLNAASISPATAQKSMKSSSLKMRKLSAMQYTTDGIASNAVAEAFYWFVPARKQLYLEATSEHMTDGRIALNMATGSETQTDKVTVKAYWLNGTSRVYVSLKDLGLTKSGITFDPTYVANIDGDLTFGDDGSATFTVKGDEDGTAHMTIKTAQTSNVEQTGDEAETALNYTAATTSVTIDVSGRGNLMAPVVSPYSRNFDRNFEAAVKGHADTKTYYLLLDNGGVSTMATDEETGGEETGGEVTQPQIPDADQLIEAVGEYDPAKADPLYVAAGTIDGDSQVTMTIAAKTNGNYTLCAVATETAAAADGTVNKSRVASAIYTYNKIEAPVLSPGIEGSNNSYPFGDRLEVEANVQSQNATIYYVADQPLSFKINDNGTITTNAQIYDASAPITVTNTTEVQAIAYNEALGIVSDIVTYRYAKKASDINEPWFVIDTQEYTNGDKYTMSLKDKKVTIKATYYDADGKLQPIGGDKVDWNNDIYHIYYTIDGTDISAGSMQYTGPVTINNAGGNVKIIAAVYADGKDANGNKGDRSISDASVLHVLNSGMIYWETTEVNSPGGVLQNSKQSIAKDGKTLVDIEFGGSKDGNATLSWKHYVSKEYATGNPIDNIGKYTIAPALDADEDVADVKDEMGNLWNHSKANDQTAEFQTHKATYGLPASGAYVKLEPQTSGKLTIWCCQEGALYYSNRSTDKESFNEGFLRKRPAYMIDEAGRSYLPQAEAAGVLSANWNTAIQQGMWNAKGEKVNGIEQTLYTSEQTEKIYNMFNSVILGKNASLNSSLQPLIVYLNTEANKMVAGFNVAEDPREEDEKEAVRAYAPDPVIDGTGVCLPSASYMKYTFDVQAGKTYFFFGWMTKIGIRGIGFEPADDATATKVIYTDKSGTQSSSQNDFTEDRGKTFAKVTVKRTFTKGMWTTIVLPFSVNDSQLKKVFGNGTEVLHYRTIEGTTMHFFKHYHQMIVAGTPVLIKPSENVADPVFENVTIETYEAADMPRNDYGFDGVTSDDCPMRGSFAGQDYKMGDYYLSSKTGLVTKLSKDNVMPGTRAYIVGTRDDGTPTTLSSMAKAAYDDLTPTDMGGEPTDIDIVTGDDDGNAPTGHGKVYNLNGQLMRQQATGTQGLANGVYVVDGKKVIVK